MALRSILVLMSGLGLVFVTACTTVLGVEEVPLKAVVDGGGLSSGDGGSATPEGGAGDVNGAVDAYTNAYCKKFQQCFAASFSLQYADVAECTVSLSANVKRDAVLPGSTATAADFQGCESRVTALTCDTFASSDSRFVCARKGTRKVNDRCLSNGQCASGLCATDDKVCRGCVDVPTAGQPCAAGAFCGPGLRCNAAGNCVTEAGESQACTADKPCILGLECVSGTCTRLPTKAGDACVDAVGCDVQRGLFCVDEVCIQATFGKAGAECGYEGNPGEQPRLCLRNAECSAITNRCNEPPTKAGDPCGAPAGNCLLPLLCLDGKCAEPRTSSFCQ